MMTLSNKFGTEQEIRIGAELNFRQIWNGDGGDEVGKAILDTSCVSPDK